MKISFLKNKKLILFYSFIMIISFFIYYLPKVKADNGWITETLDGYYPVGNDIEVKIDIINSNKYSINDVDNIFYNGQKVYIKIDWRAINKVVQGTSFKIELPVNKNLNQISFESPLTKNVEVVSDDGLVVTALNKDGSIITSFFDAKEQRPIENATTGTILIPHNVFVNSEGLKVPPHTMQILLTSNENKQKIIQKQISKISNGLFADNFSIKNQDNKEEIREFTQLRKNKVLLSFDYHSGNFGINNGDALLFKLDSYSDGNKVGKFMPFAYEPINITDGNGKIVGVINFSNRINEDGNTYMRIMFNDSFKDAKSVKGTINVLQELNFNNAIDDDSYISFSVNKEDKNLVVKGPKINDKAIENRFEIFISDLNIIRKNIAVNEIDLLSEKKQDVPVIENFILEEKVNYDNYFIDPDSIRIVKILNKKENSKDSITSFGIDQSSLKPTTTTASDRIGESKSSYDSQRGLTINEFKSYIGKNEIIKYNKDANGNVLGFSLDLGKLNETRGVTGEYTVVDSNNSITKVSKDKKAFGYLVYYNILDTTKIQKVENKNLGTVRLQIIDKNDIPVANVKIIIKNNENFSETAVTNKDGYIEFSNLVEGNYEIKENADNSNIKPITFEINKKNISNLDLTLDTSNKSRNDLFYQTRIYQSGSGKTTEGFINVLKSNHQKGRLKIIFKDAVTNEPIPSGEFIIFDKEGYRLDGDLGAVKIQKNGEGLSEYLPLGSYYFVQSKASNGYIVDKSKFDFELDKENEITFNITNIGEAKLEVFCFDDSTRQSIDSSTFTLYPYNDIKTAIEVITTSSDGKAVTNKIPFGRYYLKQTGANKKYNIYSVNIPIVIKSDNISEDGFYRIEVSNKALPNNLPIIPVEEFELSTEETKVPLGMPDLITTNNNASKTEKKNPVTADGFSYLPYILATGIVIFLIFLRQNLQDKMQRK